RFGGRARQRGWRLLRLAPSRHTRFRPQALFAQRWHDLHLRAHHSRVALAATGAVWKEVSVSTEAASAGPVTALGRSDHPAARVLIRRHYVRWWETLPWLAAVGFYFLFPDYLGFGTALMITILFALSLDLALGYAGIITLGHAAFFGAGAYTVGLLAFHNI